MKPCKHEIYVDGCRICYLFENDSRYKNLWSGPSIIRKGFNFIKAITKHTLSGFSTVSEDELKIRLDICNQCSEKHGDSCNQCGCNLNLKASWATQNCPLKKWPDRGIKKEGE